MGWVGGGLCDFGVTPVPIGLGFGFWTALGLDLGLRGPDMGLGLDNNSGSLLRPNLHKYLKLKYKLRTNNFNFGGP